MSAARNARRFTRRAAEQAIGQRLTLGQHYFLLGRAAENQGAIEEAISWCEKAIAASPAFFECHSCLAALYAKLEHWDASRQSFSRVVAFRPKGAWFEFERAWTGQESLAGKTLLLHDLCGIGDAFQFCRYALPFAACGVKVILSVRPALLDLMKTVPGPHRVIANSSPQPSFDYQIDLQHLPWVLEQSIATFYAPQAYLRASESLTAAWRKRLGNSGKPRVGLAWWTATGTGSGLRRSLALGDLIEQLPSTLEYVSLQHQVRESDEGALRSSSIAHFGEEMTFSANCMARVALSDEMPRDFKSCTGQDLSGHRPYFLDRAAVPCRLAMVPQSIRQPVVSHRVALPPACRRRLEGRARGDRQGPASAQRKGRQGRRPV